LVSEKILGEVRLQEVHFRSIATPGDEVFINNTGSWLGVELGNDVDTLVRAMDAIRKEKEVHYPLFREDNLETTVFWSSRIGSDELRGYITFREPYAEKQNDLGRIEIDLFSAGKDEDVIFADYMMGRIQNNRLDFDVLQRVISLVYKRTDESRHLRYREPTMIIVSPSDFPLSKFYEAYAMGIRGEKPLLSVFISVLGELEKIWEGIDHFHFEGFSPSVDRLNLTFNTLDKRLLSSALSAERVMQDLMVNSRLAKVAITPGSIIVSSRDSLMGFLQAMVKTYDSVLSPVYDLVDGVLKQLKHD
jgi:hypothetical protein